MDLNKVMLIGRVTRQPEMRTTNSGQNVVSFSLATNRTWTDREGNRQDQVEFHNIVAWGRLAEICNQYLNKGKKIYVEGRLQTRDWEAQDGTKRYKTEIIMENMIMLDNNKNENNNSPNNNEEPVIVPIEESKEDEVNLEDIPF